MPKLINSTIQQISKCHYSHFIDEVTEEQRESFLSEVSLQKELQQHSSYSFSLWLHSSSPALNWGGQNDESGWWPDSILQHPLPVQWRHDSAGPGSPWRPAQAALTGLTAAPRPGLGFCNGDSAGYSQGRTAIYCLHTPYQAQALPRLWPIHTLLVPALEIHLKSFSPL